MTREEVINGLYDIKNWKCNGDAEMYKTIVEAIQALKQPEHATANELPSVTPKRKTGKWIKRDVSRQIHGISCSAPNYQCSVCKKWWFHNGEGLKWYKFCPECGADMRQREENK